MLDSATVVGPDAGLADALATALVIAGAYGVRFLREIPEYSAYLISGGRAQMFGPPSRDADLRMSNGSGSRHKGLLAWSREGLGEAATHTSHIFRSRIGRWTNTDLR